MAILAPAVITLMELEPNSSLVMDFNEEENQKEEKKEINEKDIFFHTWLVYVNPFYDPSSHYTSTYLDPFYSNTVEVFLPPPEQVG